MTTKREGGGSEVSPLQKKRGGGSEKVLVMLKGWGTKRFEIVLKRELEVLAIVTGGRKKFPPFKRN